MFSTGVREEPRLLDELRGIGATVWETDPETGAQWRVSACDGHFGGSLDGVAQGLPEAPKSAAVLEFKTHNHKSFTSLIENKVQKSKPQHFDQMQVYMGLMQIDRAMYLAVDKDTDDLYCEWVHFDSVRFEQLIDKAQSLINSAQPPTRLSQDPSFFICKMCNFHRLCHGQMAAEANCRTCCHASPVANAQWHCESHNKKISLKEQQTGCDRHLLIPALVSYAEPQDGGDNYVIYKHKESGKEFSNGPGPEPRFTSAELHNCPGQLLGEIAEIKSMFPTAKVVSGNFDDMQSDIDDAKVKPESTATKEKRVRNSKTLQALENFKPKVD